MRFFSHKSNYRANIKSIITGEPRNIQGALKGTFELVQKFCLQSDLDRKKREECGKDAAQVIRDRRKALLRLSELPSGFGLYEMIGYLSELFNKSQQLTINNKIQNALGRYGLQVKETHGRLVFLPLEVQLQESSELIGDRVMSESESRSESTSISEFERAVPMSDFDPEFIPEVTPASAFVSDSEFTPGVMSESEFVSASESEPESNGLQLMPKCLVDVTWRSGYVPGFFSPDFDGGIQHDLYEEPKFILNLVPAKS